MKKSPHRERNRATDQVIEDAGCIYAREGQLAETALKIDMALAEARINWPAMADELEQSAQQIERFLKRQRFLRPVPN